MKFPEKMNPKSEFSEQSRVNLSPTRRIKEELSNNNRAIKEVCEQLALSRLPLSEPEIFNGSNPLQFPIWQMAFDSLIGHKGMAESEKLNLLNKYLGGEAKVAIQGYLFLPPSEAFTAAYNVLVNRYGDNLLWHGHLRSV